MRGLRADPVPCQAFMQNMTPGNGDLEIPNFLFQQVDKSPRRGQGHHFNGQRRQSQKEQGKECQEQHFNFLLT